VLAELRQSLSAVGMLPYLRFTDIALDGLR
jgi:hypothetical protein